MNKLIFLLPMLLIPVLVSANWYCGGIEYYDCSEQYPVETCINGVVICNYLTQDPTQYCVIKDNGDTYDDYWFCNNGQKAICNVQSPYQNNMVCCPNDFPVWNENYQQCWKQGWECTGDSQCNAPNKCIDNTCQYQCVPSWTCGDWSQCSSSSSTQTRSCSDGCGQTKTESQSCEPDQCAFPSDCNSWCRSHTCNKGKDPGEWECINSKCSWLYTGDGEEDGDGNGGDKIVRPDMIDFVIIIMTFIILAIVWVI